MALASFFRRRGHDQGLPTTSAPSSRSSVFSLRHNPNDGSARNIRLEKSLAKTWSQTSFATKATYCSLVFFLMMLYFGIRWIRYSNAFIHLNCRLETCELKIVPLGWGRKLRLEFPRRQLLDAMPVKTDASGVFVEGTPNVNDDYLPRQTAKKKGKKYSAASKPSSKGPDADGNYVSYAIVLTDQDPEADTEVAEPNRDGEEGDNANQVLPVQDLSMFKEYLEPLESKVSDDGKTPLRQYRLILRKFRIAQSKRRVRTILTKLEAYIKHRRTLLVVKETSPPAWQGILGIVLGLMGALLTLLIGQLWDESSPSASGPGVRRESRGGSNRSSVDRPRETMKRTTPAKYEVATSHQHQRHRLTTASRRSTTTTNTNVRDGLKQPWIQPSYR